MILFLEVSTLFFNFLARYYVRLLIMQELATGTISITMQHKVGSQEIILIMIIMELGTLIY